MAALLPRQTNPSGSFLNPGAGPRQSWALGTTQNITYTTVFSSYTIALWQQYSSGGGANLGPILLSKQASSTPQTSFLWAVQLYGFDLAQSDEFFFWIFNGTDAAAQGNVPAPSVSSAYFTIKEADLISTTSGTSTTTASKTASTTATRASNGDGTGTPLTTGDASAAATGGGDGSGVNVVAVGVGVGVGVLVLVGLAALAVWWWLWKKTPVLDGLKKKARPGSNDPAEMDLAPPAPDPNKTFMYPAAGYGFGLNHAAELSVGPAAVEMGVTNTGGPGTRAELPGDEFVGTRTDSSNRAI